MRPDSTPHTLTLILTLTLTLALTLILTLTLALTLDTRELTAALSALGLQVEETAQDGRNGGAITLKVSANPTLALTP